MNLRAWQARHGFTYNTAAAALGISRSTYRRLLHKAELPKLVQPGEEINCRCVSKSILPF